MGKTLINPQSSLGPEGIIMASLQQVDGSSFWRDRRPAMLQDRL